MNGSWTWCCDECGKKFPVDDLIIVRVPLWLGADCYYCKECRERLDNE